jgi:hypothetical protein
MGGGRSTLRKAVSTKKLSVTGIKKGDHLAELVNEENLVLKWIVKKYDGII